VRDTLREMGWMALVAVAVLLVLAGVAYAISYIVMLVGSFVD
jgi:hypothetical protein